MDRFNQINPFSKRESYSQSTIVTYKILTALTWALSVIVSVYYSLSKAESQHGLKGRTIPGQNYRHPTHFTLYNPLLYTYFIILFISQIGYIFHLFASDVRKVNAACACGSHFIFNNLLHFAFVMLFVRSYFVPAEIILIVNFFNLSSLAFRHAAHPRFIHVPVVSGPLAWTFVALYWNGAIMIPHITVVAAVVANIFVWSILAYGLFFLVAYKDYTMGFWLSLLSAALAVSQVRHHVHLQGIFAFIIMGNLFGLSAVFATANLLSRELSWERKKDDATDAERAPLLADN
ncbi:hypothetical protein BD289DRAFT_419927 [Coniella lustricola]|uniref:ATP synthase F0 n=1 Tax=Coniella lustricola TaxID=2025994 RepID=A0A2T3ANS9_9PEZI|nr:hypothetical protein BD289DRAFT_419927 [Coniella lustricola]